MRTLAKAVRPALFLAALLLPLPSGAVTVPPGFVAHEVASSGGWVEPLGIEVAPDGRLFVIEKRGRVHVVENDFKVPQPFINLEQEVLNNGDRGLLGIALDPAFATNQLVYLLYTVDPNGDGNDDEVPSFSRLTRYRASATNRNVADLGSRFVLIGDTWATGIPSIYNTHTIGSVRFGSDGTLLLSAGDGAHADTADAGGRDPGAFGPGKLPLVEDIGAFRSQWVGSLAGKVLRIDPATGGGLPSNPFYTGDPFAAASRVWAYGLRNPYRFRPRPGTGSTDRAAGDPGTLYIGDTGWKTWEELNVAQGGENFGWPCKEGPVDAEDYPSRQPSHHGCSTIGTAENPVFPKAPLITWHHTSATSSIPPIGDGKCVAGIAFYIGTLYPAVYRGACFFADYDRGWIKAARVDGNDNLIEVLDFATDCFGPVDIATDPATGDLFYVSILRNEIRRIRFDTTNRPPVAAAAASPTAGNAPLLVQFSSNGSSDPDGDAISHFWTFGDGGTAAEPHPSHTYTGGGEYQAVLTVSDGRGGQASRTVTIQVAGPPGNRPPVPAILSPESFGLFLPGAELVLQGSATDPEDPPGSLALSWEIVLRHNTHIHPAWLTFSGPTASFIPRDHDDGTGTWFEIILRATDPHGLTGTKKAYVFPDPEPMIIDNGAPGTSSTGYWPQSSGLFSFGPTSVYSKVVGATYSYTFAVPIPGEYRVYAWWTTANTRTTAAPFRIDHARGSETVTVNQRDITLQDRWNLLGTHVFTGSARVTITAVGGTVSTGADAVALLPARTAIGDNARAGVSMTGNWLDSGGPNPYAESSVYSKIAGHTFTHRLEPPWTGVADVYGWWTQLSTRPTAAPYSIAYATGSHTVLVNQQVNGGKWNYLGTYALGSAPTITITSTGGPSTGADAVRLVHRPRDAILDAGSPGTVSTGSWSVSSGTGSYGPTSLFAKNTTGVGTYRYTIPIVEPGAHEVLAWWTTATSRSSQVPYVITHSSGTITVHQNQLTNGSRWNSLGTYAFGTTATVTIQALPDGKSVCADAIRLRRSIP